MDFLPAFLTDSLILSRLQFAFALSVHIIFPSITIGLAFALVVFEWMWLRTGDTTYRYLCKFWTKIFALSFGVGVVSGLTLSYMFGTNFNRFSELTGNVIGPLLAYEVLTAFFLEATFLGVMLFGWKRVSPGFHFFSTCAVFIGTLLSAFWILAAVSWMHTPQGTAIGEDGVFYVQNWLHVIFTPSFPYRYVHMILAAFLTGTFMILGISAWQYVRAKKGSLAHKMGLKGMRYAAIWAIIFAPLQLFTGDLHGINTFHHQPMKVAAMEGAWETKQGAPLILFGIPDQEAEMNHYEIAIPNLASLILTHKMDGEVPGLKEVAPEDRPRVSIVFYSFRVMVGIGLFLILLGVWAWWHRRTDFKHAKTFFYVATASVPLPIIAVLAGWYTTEVGRQPWIVQGLLRVADTHTPIAAEKVLFTLLMLIGIYIFVFIFYLLYFNLIVKNSLSYKDEIAKPAMKSAPVSKTKTAKPKKKPQVKKGRK